MRYRLGVLLGDDIGSEVVPEAMRAARAAAEALRIEIDWLDLPIGMAAYRQFGTTLPDDTFERLSKLDGWILGPIGHRAYPKDPRAVNPHPKIRKHFDMFSSFRPAKSYLTLPSVHQNVDVVLLREQNEGFQPDRNVVAGSGEFRPTEDVTISARVITRHNSSRIARAAFELARTRPRRQVTAVHKDTVFKLGCGMFAEECRKVAQEFPDVAYDEVIVDTFAMKAAMQPQQFDVVVTTNMFGDILADLLAGLVGGLGLAPALSAGPRYAMAQATHGSAPDIAGKGIANPYAEIMSMQMLLDWLGRQRQDARMSAAADAIRRAVEEVIAKREPLTPDLGGKASTQEMGGAIAELAGRFAAEEAR